MMQSLHVLRFALRGSLLPLHLEQRLCRPVGASEQESEASTSPRHRTRCARRCLLQLRCCTPLPLCNTLFQRLALLSDTSLVQSAFGRAFSLRSPLRARDILSSASIPHCGALALFAWRQSGLVAAMLTRYTISLRSSAGLPCARLRQHSVAVGGSGQESVASRCATAAAAFITTHSFNGWRCCPIPTFAQTSLRNSFASSLHSHVASILRRFVGLTFIAHRMMARN